MCVCARVCVCRAFFKQELYDLQRQVCKALEHCADIAAFASATKRILQQVLSALVPGGVLALHLPQKIVRVKGVCTLHPIVCFRWLRCTT